MITNKSEINKNPRISLATLRKISFKTMNLEKNYLNHRKMFTNYLRKIRNYQERSMSYKIAKQDNNFT